MNIFLSTPISCFKEKQKLLQYKKDIMSLVSALKESHIVCSEIENIGNVDEYDSPSKSIETDINSIKACELFIMHYPSSIPTSALIELGFAIAFEKQIIIITPDKNKLPYLARGIPLVINRSVIIEAETINHDLIQRLTTLISK